MSSHRCLLTLGPPFALALAICLAAPASTHADDDTHRERRIKIVACDGGEVTDIQADDLALGETRDVATSCGKVVSVTRTAEDQIRVAVDGEEISIPGGGLDDIEIDEDGDGNVRKKVIVRKLHGHDCDEGEECPEHRVRKIVIGGDGEGELDADVITLLGDELDLDCEEGEEACQAEILRLLGDQEGDGDHVVVIKKVHRQDDGDDEDDNE